MEGCGCRMWLSTPRDRFAPAESPAREIELGG